jgi:hypothetical protein
MPDAASVALLSPPMLPTSIGIAAVDAGLGWPLSMTYRRAPDRARWVRIVVMILALILVAFFVLGLVGTRL